MKAIDLEWTLQAGDNAHRHEEHRFAREDELQTTSSEPGEGGEDGKETECEGAE